MTTTPDDYTDLEAKAKAAQAQAPTPWERDTECPLDRETVHNVLLSGKGARMLDSLNSEMSGYGEEFDEDGYRYWDSGTMAVFEFLAAAHPAVVLGLIGALREMTAARDNFASAAAEARMAQGGLLELLAAARDWGLVHEWRCKLWIHEGARGGCTCGASDVLADINSALARPMSAGAADA